jgi:putative transposase
VLACPACQFTGHRDLSAAANIAARNGGGITPVSLLADVTHRRAGAHLPGVAPSRRDPRRRAHHRGARGSLAGTGPLAPAPSGLARESLAILARSLDTARNYRQVH